jgi:4-azaleucine resistance transporter AzlC
VFRSGFRAMAPLWLGVVPFGVAYAVLARGAGLSLVETQALSLLVFAGSSQVSAVGLFGRGSGGLEIVFTTLLLNVRHVLYGLSLGRSVPLTRRERLATAFFLTDEAYGVSVARGARTFPFVLGAELSLYLTWNLATLAGALLGGVIPDPEKLGVDFVFPLAFLALLIPLLRRRVDVLVAVVAGVLAWVLARNTPGGLPIVIAGVVGSLLGAVLTRRGERS